MALAAGHDVGAYTIVGPLGSGGMGEVYSARDSRLGRLVAIKFVSTDLQTDSAAAARFDREARLASSLNHPGIVTVHDIGQADGRTFIVMELVDGESLATRLARGRLKINDAVQLAVSIAEALAVAHDAGIVHRDLKPQNIMVTRDGRPKIVDFGLSKIAAPPSGSEDSTVGAGVTARHVALGTPGYMAPEQILGTTVDFTADQFALGAVMYEMVTGRRAFRRDSAVQTMSSTLDDQPTPLLEVCPDAPAALAAVIARCLDKQRDRRYGSTRDLCRDLRDALGVVDGDPSHRSRPLTAGRRSVGSIVAAILVVLIVAAAALVWGLKSRPRPGPSPDPAVRQIVVLPLTNITKEPTDQTFCDGLVETLTNSLSQLEPFQRSLRVVPASEVAREHVASAKDARDAFGATLVVSGAIQRSASGRRVTLNLVDAVTLQQLSSRRIDVGLGTETSTQDAVVSAIAGLLNLQLEPEARRALTAGGTATPAYEYYVEGRGLLQRFDKVENVDRAIDRFTRALDIDGRYALAYAALGEAQWRKYELDRQPVWIDRAVDSCGRSLTIDDRLASVHVTLSMIARGRGRFEDAIAAAERAIQLDPVSGEGYRELARAYEAANRTADAEATYQKAIQARPNDWLLVNALGGFYLAHARYAEAETAFRHVIDLTPDNTRGYNNLGATYFNMRRPEEAAAMWERSAAIRPTGPAMSNLGVYYFDSGRYADSARAFERAVSLTATDYRLWHNLGAALYWAPGERPKSRAAFEQAVRLAEEARRVNPRQPDLLSQLADAYSMLGRSSEARATAAEVERLAPVDPTILFTLATTYEQIGDRARALDLLDKAVRSGYSRERVERSPGLQELRKDPRYLRLGR